MRALTLIQPWATLVARYGKDVENRSWAPPAWMIGRAVAVHAGTRWDAVGWHSAVLTYGAQLPAYDPERYPGGVVVAVATIAGVCRPSHPVTPCGCGRWAVLAGQVHWRLAEVCPLPEPVPCKGALGIWTLPVDVEAAVQIRLRRVRPVGRPDELRPVFRPTPTRFSSGRAADLRSTVGVQGPRAVQNLGARRLTRGCVWLSGRFPCV